MLRNRKPFADRLAEIVQDREGNGSWLGHIFMFAIAAMMAVSIYSYIKDKLETRAINKEIAEIVERSNAEREALNKQIQLRDADIEAKQAELKWARQREQHHIKERERLESENEELTKLLNTKLPADLFR